jgi:carbamoyl-phosphate synthase small subunit
VLALEDGTVFLGNGFGAEGEHGGEVVFNTALSGYQEILTDPSYHGQIVTMTAPHIGNVGVNSEDLESGRAWTAGFVVKELSPRSSNWRANKDLSAWLEEQGVVGIEGIDTRALTRRLRIGGALKAIIASGTLPRDPRELCERARAWPGLEGRDLAREVTCAERYAWDAPSWRVSRTAQPGAHVVVYDFGVKQNILRRLCDLGLRVTVVPATTSAQAVRALAPDGILLSNGPGDPAALPYAASSTRELVEAGLPLFGICLGHQILGLALGGRTYKLRFGHHGANHPVKDLASGSVEITSQNHGFAVDVASLAGRAVLTHVNLNDETVEGMRLDGRPVMSVQYHPEASPGPHDSRHLFDRFFALLGQGKAHLAASSTAQLGSHV